MKFLLEIGYKSGNKVTLWFEEFKITTNSFTKYKEIEWKLAQFNQDIVDLGIENIEYIVQLDSKE